MNTKPDKKTIEVSLIGTGGGYGESIVAHIGNDRWIVVDSCSNSIKNSESLPLNYLKNIGVKVKEDVKIIICTHWHDDHIRAISKLFKECEQAKFCTSEVSDRRKFLQMVCLDDSKLNDNGISISSTKEFNMCLQLLKERNGIPIGASSNKRIFYLNENSIVSEIWALSPSDFVKQEFNKELSTLMNDYMVDNTKIPFKKPNDKSVALFLKIGNHRILLGSDLEFNKNNSNMGWLDIIENSNAIDEKCTIYKIAHHGSYTAYTNRIFNELLVNSPILKLTPWNISSKLPTDEMISIFKEHSDRLHITSSYGSKKPKKRRISIEKLIKDENRSLREIKPNIGIIRCRIDYNAEPLAANWSIDHFGNAYAL